MATAPVLKRTIKGIKRYSWRICPYSTVDITNRVPQAQKREHTTTSGKMRLSIRDGHGGVGWECDDPACPFFTGEATTSVWVQTMEVTVNKTTGEYTLTPGQEPSPLCSGARFWEK